MMKKNNLIKSTSLFVKLIAIMACSVFVTNCDNFLETDNPVGQIPQEDVFNNETTATAALTTLYAKLRDDVLLTGSSQGLNFQLGLYADELDYFGVPGQPLEVFYSHQIIASDISVARTWNNAYNLIHMTNATIEGLNASQSLAENVKLQLKGEALFIRALVHFYLVNIYGDIPYIKTTNYVWNSEVYRMLEVDVYDDIVDDLLESKNLLSVNYATNERIRANRYVASALLSRVYLYTSQWENAENESSLVIDNTTLYNLEANLENEFLKTSQSAILQLKTKITSQPTSEAINFTFTSGPPPLVALNPNLINGMEPNDNRLNNWIGVVTNGAETWYYPKKYIQSTNTQYSTVFRLAELFLIRAEARTRLNDLAGAQSDINTIRQRAGLPQTLVSTQETLINAILKERQVELFTEQGHRWFDLKRLGLAVEIIQPLKPAWSDTDMLFPIPELEILMNPNLNPQNSGY